MAGALIFVSLLVFLLEGFNFVIIVGCYVLPTAVFIVRLSQAIQRDKGNNVDKGDNQDNHRGKTDSLVH